MSPSQKVRRRPLSWRVAFVPSPRGRSPAPSRIAGEPRFTDEPPPTPSPSARRCHPVPAWNREDRGQETEDRRSTSSRGHALTFLIFCPLASVLCPLLLAAGPQASPFWDVDDIREGMTGVGRTVLKGTKLEEFRFEVLGVLRNTSPGRDMVLARLSGLELEKTGVIAGMSGSPVYIDGKLLGAVAYAWPFGKEPIAGITPITQMIAYGDAHDRKACCEPRRVGLRQPLDINGRTIDEVTVASGHEGTESPEGLWLVPLRTPLAATGFTPHSVALLGDALKHT